jgi:hypothetical protein
MQKQVCQVLISKCVHNNPLTYHTQLHSLNPLLKRFVNNLLHSRVREVGCNIVQRLAIVLIP